LTRPKARWGWYTTPYLLCEFFETWMILKRT
jgi:hypothetical protein